MLRHTAACLLVYQYFRTTLVLICQTTLYCNPEEHKMNYLVSLQKAIHLFICLLSLRMLILWRKYMIRFQSVLWYEELLCHISIFFICVISSVYLFLQGHYSISPISFVTSCHLACYIKCSLTTIPPTCT